MGELNRAELRKKEIFAEKIEKNWLNHLLHPAIREECRAVKYELLRLR